MTTVFVVSAILLVVLVGVRHLEFVRGDGRILERYRTYLDIVTIKGIQKIILGIKSAMEYIHKDIFLNGLHMVTYIALLAVRLTEKKLENMAVFLRSFRRNNRKKMAPGKITTIFREGDKTFGEEKKE